MVTGVSNIENNKKSPFLLCSSKMLQQNLGNSLPVGQPFMLSLGENINFMGIDSRK